MAKWGEDARQATWLGFSVWTLSCGLFVLPTYFGTGPLPPRFIEHVAVLYVVGMVLTAVIHLATVRVRHSAIAVRLAAMTGAVLMAAALLGVADFTATWWLRMAERADASAAVAKTLKNSIGFIWPYGLIAAILIIIQANRTVRERERELADARATEI